MKTQSNNSTQSKTTSTKTSKNEGLQSSPLMKIFESELKDIYWAEKALTQAIPKMVTNATSKELIKALENHLAQTEKQINRVEKVFESIDKTPAAKKCKAMEGLIKEGEEIMEECEAGAMRDAGIILAGQKVEHYEIATYGTLRQFAETLMLQEAVNLLEQTLVEEKAADAKLTEIAVSMVNAEAAGTEEE